MHGTREKKGATDQKLRLINQQVMRHANMNIEVQ